ncbi:MAG: MFS transporter [bacterium]|nr:MFS transporter [bacterium]
MPRDECGSRYAIALCYTTMMCLALAVNLPPIYLTTFAHVFGGSEGLTEEQLGRIPAMVFGSRVVAIVLGGSLADRFGARRFAVLGLVLNAVGLGVLATAPSYSAILLATGIMGAGSGLLDMIMSPIMCALQPNNRGSALNWLHSFYCIGAVFTVAIGAMALWLQLPWRLVFGAFLALPLLVGIGFMRLRLPPLIQNGETPQPISGLMVHGAFLAALVLVVCTGATETGIVQWLPAYAERSLGYSKSTGALALAGFSVGMMIGRIGAARLAKRVSLMTIMTVCAASTAVLIVAGMWLPVRWAALTACVLVGMTSSCVWPSTLALTADRFPRGGAPMFAVLSIFGNGGCVLMPWVVGLAAARTSLPIAMTLVCFWPVLMVVVLLWLSRRSPTQTSA